MQQEQGPGPVNPLRMMLPAIASARLTGRLLFARLVFMVRRPIEPRLDLAAPDL